MKDDIVIPRRELRGLVPPRWSGLTDYRSVNGERWACEVPDGTSLAQWHYEQALVSLAIAAEMKERGL